ncbi:hypothetical protein ACM01_44855 [Streptomyces viridochromogenes]|uniref:Uncharacterized protein n=1 Tax=Streptomyces viridochromogenes TaxID=1938 RepID=A0A0J7YUI8_STRVR|nr:hypothetical protein ACM01_44855 [Streptomyces viridochromogenes]
MPDGTDNGSAAARGGHPAQPIAYTSMPSKYAAYATTRAALLQRAAPAAGRGPRSRPSQSGRDHRP